MTDIRPVPPPPEPPQPGVPTVDLLADTPRERRRLLTVSRWVMIVGAVILAAGIGGTVGAVMADDSDTVDSQRDALTEAQDDLQSARADARAAEREADEARDEARQARSEGYDAGYADGDADGYFEGYDVGWNDALDPFEPYSPLDDVTGVPTGWGGA
jgi:hypothetical protein